MTRISVFSVDGVCRYAASIIWVFLALPTVALRGWLPLLAMSLLASSGAWNVGIALVSVLQALWYSETVNRQKSKSRREVIALMRLELVKEHSEGDPMYLIPFG